MLATCTECQCEICRYPMTAEEWKSPCPKCGSEILYITHLGIYGKPHHRFRMNVVTGEKIDPDPCDAREP